MNQVVYTSSSFALFITCMFLSGLLCMYSLACYHCLSCLLGMMEAWGPENRKVWQVCVRLNSCA